MKQIFHEIILNTKGPGLYDFTNQTKNFVNNKKLANGILNIATGNVTSFYKIARMVMKDFKKKNRIVKLARNGPKPHGGYRAFSAALTKKSFPKFKYTSISAGIKKSYDEAIKKHEKN